MADRSGGHFSDDDELLSQYALGKLDAAARDAVDRHAAGCDACRESLRREMRIAAGVRRLGRDSLKANLSARAAPRAGLSAWPRFASAAAVFIIIGGLGIYFGWLSGRGRLSTEPEGAPPVAAQPAEHDKEMRNAPDLADARSAAKGGGIPAPGGDRAAERGTSAPSVSPGAGGAGQPLENAAGESRAESTLQRGAPGGEFWSDGYVEEGVAAKKVEPRGAAAPRADVMMLDKQKSIKEEAAGEKDANSPRQSHFLLLQQPATALPAGRKGETEAGQNAFGEADRIRDQQAVQGGRATSAARRERVPTHVDQKGDTTTMTLYLDSLVDEGDLKRARVEAMGDDSVVVTLGGKKIQYRFPAPRGTQQQRAK